VKEKRKREMYAYQRWYFGAVAERKK
jgi:hypothetical protein